jgi:hypothetical protein
MSEMSFDDIFSVIPPGEWLRLYSTLHEVGEQSLYDHIMRIMGKDERYSEPAEVRH